jgi:hypothetical protein
MIITPYNRSRMSPEMRHCISELESLAIEPKKLNDLNDAYEMADLVTNIKLNWYQDYKSESDTNNSDRPV